MARTADLMAGTVVLRSTKTAVMVGWRTQTAALMVAARMAGWMAGWTEDSTAERGRTARAVTVEANASRGFALTMFAARSGIAADVERATSMVPLGTVPLFRRA
ncbi:MAG: hypothetical protein HYY84_15665 [Deltaproteobacteria bacterium]|nr:hypothetical protein [Deltaproteobacteria bacterium]